MNDTVCDTLSAFVRARILHHAVSERVYGAGMAEELGRRGYQLSPGTLYPLVHRLEGDGLLMSETEVAAGNTRKHYVATALGCEALDALHPRLAELVGEALPETQSHATAALPRSRPKR